MTYTEFVAARFTKRHTGDDGLMHCAVGIAGEAGELLDAIKKQWVYGKPLDRANAVEELGDIEWYMEALRGLLGVTRDEIIAANVAKLEVRFPVAYSDELALARLDKVEVECHHSWKVTQQGVTYHDLKCQLCGTVKRETWD